MYVFMDWKNKCNKDVNSHQTVYSFNVFPIRNLVRFFVNGDTLIPRFTWNGTGGRIAKLIFTKKNTIKKFTQYFRLFCSYSNQDTIIWYWGSIDIKMNGTK